MTENQLPEVYSRLRFSRIGTAANRASTKVLGRRERVSDWLYVPLRCGGMRPFRREKPVMKPIIEERI